MLAISVAAAAVSTTTASGADEQLTFRL